MRFPPGWQIYAKNKVDEILREVSESFPLKAPLPISKIIETYLGDVHLTSSINHDFPEGVSAFSTKDMSLGWIIMVNGKETVERQRFSAAHELAHIVLFKNQPSKVFCSKDSRSWDERLCDQFAGNLLMPEAMVRGACTSTPYLEDVAKMFKVSSLVAEIQLKRLDLPFKKTVLS